MSDSSSIAPSPEETCSQAPPAGHTSEARPLITLRGIALGALTIAAMFYYIAEVGQRMGLGSFVHSQYPMAAFIPFVLWLFLNLVLKRLWPRLALHRGELLTIFAMTWVVGTIPQLGWATYWTTSMALPAYYARPENQYAEILFDLLPWHVFPDPAPRVIDTFWHGLPEGMPLPWDGWLGAMAQWLGVSMAMVIFGFCLFLIFQRQWVEAEKLTFPLAHMPLDLTRGFDGPHRMPDLFRSRLFWIGFGVVFLPMLYNIGTYFGPGLPTLDIYRGRITIPISEHLPQGLKLRLLPLILTVVYMCPLDILGSMLVFYFLTIPKEWLIWRLGITVGAEGQQIGHPEIFWLESYGGAIFLALWSFWLARQHLRHVWFLVRRGRGDPREVNHYRLALAGLVLAGLYVINWNMSLGMSLPLAVGAFMLMVLVHFVAVKLVAATGCAYLFPIHMEGRYFIVDLVGTTHLSAQSLVGFKIFASTIFFGNHRIPVWPSLVHILRIFPLNQQPRRVLALVLIAFPVGFLTASGAMIHLGYDEGAVNVLAGGGRALDFLAHVFNKAMHLILNPTRPDAEKIGLWLLGFCEAAGIAFLRARFHWFPLHPIGVVFQYTFATWLYWFSLFVVWITKFTLLRYGGVKAYLAGKPFFYGLSLGYVIGVVLSGVVDLIWFPAEGHSVHGW